ncbi:MAG: methylcobamide--CoM methyltransferase [Clostridiaceae bacterium]|nr:methylcobamide--CoM methyltransferase [Clostridiaceae bacterium]
MKRNMKKWVLNVSNSIDRYAMPIMSFPGLEITGRTVIDMTTDGNAQFESIEALAKRYPSVAAVMPMDLSVEAEAFGSTVVFSDKEVPNVSGRIVQDRESAEALRVPKIGEGRTMVYIMAAKLTARNIKNKPIFAGMIGPFSLAGRLYGMTDIMVALVLEPETVHILLEKVTGFLIDYAKAFKKAGTNGIIIAEPAAGLLSPEQCQEFSSRYIKRIVDAVQDEYYMVILHNCGNTKKLVPSLLSTGAMGFHFGNSVDLESILPRIPWGKLAFGNINPAGVFKAGDRESVEAATWKLLESTAIYKNFVISSGCDIPPGTSLDNIDAFFETVGKFNRLMVREIV